MEFKKIDPNSAINSSMLNRLISEKKIPCGSRGNRTVIEWHILISSLNEILQFTGETFLPRIRTIRAAAKELKKSESDFGVTERHIRCCVADKKIGFIAIGSRYYIAMQSFIYPYSESLIYDESEERAKRETIKKDIMAQLSSKLSSNLSMPIVKRRTNKK